jgi:hypothetical protein
VSIVAGRRALADDGRRMKVDSLVGRGSLAGGSECATHGILQDIRGRDTLAGRGILNNISGRGALTNRGVANAVSGND